MILIEALQPGGRMAMGPQRVIVLRPHPGDPVRQINQLDPEVIGVTSKSAHRPFETQELVQLLPEQQGAIQFVAYRSHLPLDPLDVLACVSQLGLGASLGFDDPLGLLLSGREPGAQLLQPPEPALDRGKPLLHRGERFRRLGDGRDRAELRRRSLGPGHQRLERGELPGTHRGSIGPGPGNTGRRLRLLAA